jgi:hypothetical protein
LCALGLKATPETASACPPPFRNTLVRPQAQLEATQARRSGATVFSVIAALDQWPSWNPDVKSVSVEGPVRPGTVFR